VRKTETAFYWHCGCGGYRPYFDCAELKTMNSLILLAGGLAVFLFALTKKANAAPPVETQGPQPTLGLVGGAIAAVTAAILAFRSTAHLTADQWVQSVQNPFGRALAAIVDAKDASITDGTATKNSIYLARSQVVDLWTKYRASAEQFANKGVDQRLVINQSYDTLEPLIHQILVDMDNQIANSPA